jgi:hypothetical protein
MHAMTVDIADGVVQTIRGVIDPDKLRHPGPLADVRPLLARTQATAELTSRSRAARHNTRGWREWTVPFRLSSFLDVTTPLDNRSRPRRPDVSTDRAPACSSPDELVSAFETAAGKIRRCSTYRATKLREPGRTQRAQERLNKPNTHQRLAVRRYRTQEVAGSSPASSIKLARKSCDSSVWGSPKVAVCRARTGRSRRRRCRIARPGGF